MNRPPMPLDPQCMPCFLRQALLALRAAEADHDTSIAILRAVAEDVGNADALMPPSHTSTPLHRRLRSMLGRDPFAQLKHQYNEISLGLYPRLLRYVNTSANPLHTALRLAIAGNIIDFGIYDTVDIKSTIDRALNEPLAIADFDVVEELLLRHRHVLYLLDNAGEVVFDRVLIEELRSLGHEVTAVTRGSSVLNDVTMEDALQVGLDECCTVTHNGSDAVGTDLDAVSPEFMKLYLREDQTIIAKGQGNFETLLHRPEPVCFLFQAKCEVVARMLDLPLGSMILMGPRQG